MKIKFISIKWRILFTLLISISIIFGLFITYNILIVHKTRDELIFQQIENTINNKRTIEKSNIENNIWIANFVIDFRKNISTPRVIVDANTRTLYREMINNPGIINEIRASIINNKNREKGSITFGKSKTFFVVEWNSLKNIATVYISTIKLKKILDSQFILLLLLTVIISYLISLYIARTISKPIRELMEFSEEIARKNWSKSSPVYRKDEIGLLANSLEKMKTNLKESEEREHNFLQSTSHDLKTPVMIIKGYAQSIIDNIEIDSSTPPAITILNESNRLERKITQLLHFNTVGIKTQSLKRDDIRLDRMILSVVKRFKAVRPEVNWNINCPETEITGDSDSLLIAIENIIDNQVRYAANCINISIQTGENIVISFSNDGPHFTTDNIQSIFDLYQKDKNGNFGLGLHIAKKVIEAHNGIINAFNRDMGVEFKINLKLR